MCCAIQRLLLQAPSAPPTRPGACWNSTHGIFLQLPASGSPFCTFKQDIPLCRRREKVLCQPHHIRFELLIRQVHNSMP